MAWVKLIHDCPLPGCPDIPWPDERKVPGTQWQCDDCGDLWEVKKETLDIGMRVLVRWNWDRIEVAA